MGRRTRSTSKDEDDDEHHPAKPLRTSTRATLFALLLLLFAATTTPARASVEIRALAANSPVAYAGSSAYYLKQYDVCGVCDGDTTTCQGCDRVPNSPSIFDACGSCGSPSEGPSGTFNKTCTDCSGNQDAPGEVYGHKVRDDCGVCRDPADPLFSRAGLPDYHLGGCVGCDGVPFSGIALDPCGVCGGRGCSNSEPSLRSWCCDCDGVPFGPHIVNFCCQCVHRENHWSALSEGTSKGPPETHSVALDMWTRGRERVVNGSLELNNFRAALELSSAEGEQVSTYGRSDVVYRPFREAREYFKRGWDAIRDPGSDDNSTCYREVYLEGNATNPRDICGVCGGDNSTCLGCNPSGPDLRGDPFPDGGLLLDDCDVCGGANADVDHCQMCFGSNETCNGCDGLPNSGKVKDGCLGSKDIRVLTFTGAVGEVGSGCSDPAEFKASCDAGGGGCCGCDGIPNSPKRLDGCNACFDQTNENNTRLINATCNGCDGVAFSGVTYDACCVCGGDSDFTSQCYLDLLTEGENATAPFDPYTMNYSAYFTEEGRLLIDECGECRLWRYGGSTCLGCDGVHGSGLVEDGCGVCGGDCSSCAANETGLPYNCSGPGSGWTGMDQTCAFVRTEGPSQAWVNWSAFPNGTDGEGQKTVNESWYERLNRPGLPAFVDAARGECRMYLEPPPPLGPRETREWVVKAYGKEEGPYTLDELETGTITVTDISGEIEALPLLPTTLVARVTTYYQQQTITYGATSMYQDRVNSWQQRVGDKMLRSPLEPGVDNAVVVEGLATELWHGGQFMPMSVMPGMERIIYPYCSGSTWRGAAHRLHGKKLPGNYLGIITTENITDVEGLTDQAWNPLDEYIYDVSVGWMDQKCTCSAEWQYDSAPVAPTCPKVWFPWSGWVEDGWYVSHNTYVNDTDRYSVAQRRSWAGGGWRVSGGWWTQDYGGGDPAQFGSVGTLLRNAYGGPEDFGFGAVRGPVRLDAAGFLSVTTVVPSGGDRAEGGAGAGGRDRCYAAARLSQPRRNTSGAVWSDQRQDVAGGWTTSFDFLVAELAEKCTDVHAVSRSFSEAVHTRAHRTCAAAGGDGFAFVIRDDTDAAPGVGDVGEPGPGIGYQGLRHSLAVEFDTWHNPLNDEPYERHVAVHTNGGDPNDAHHAARLGSTADVPDFTDGGTHRAVITYVASAGWEAVAAALESGAYRGATPRLSHFTTQNTGLMTVYVDDLETPLLTVPLTVDTVLRAGGKTAWVGFTSGTGETWQIVDLVSWNFTSA